MTPSDRQAGGSALPLPGIVPMTGESKNAATPYSDLQAVLHHGGIDGRGIRIGLIDLDTSTQHTRDVRAVLESVAPGVAGDGTEVLPYNYRLLNWRPGDTAEELAEFLRSNACAQFEHMSALIDVAAAKRQDDPTRRVLCIPVACGPKFSSENIFGLLEEKREDGGFAYPTLRQLLYGSQAESLRVTEKKERVQQYVEGFLGIQPELAADQADYVAATRLAAESGLIILVAGGNRDGWVPPGSAIPAQFEFNRLAVSPWVISVAAYDMLGTPEDLTDDRISDDSAPGAPTLAAPGYKLPAGDKTVSGTSFAVAYAAGVVAMMLQVNPKLSYADVRRIVCETAYDHAESSAEMEGAGSLDAIDAVCGAYGGTSD